MEIEEKLKIFPSNNSANYLDKTESYIQTQS